MMKRVLLLSLVSLLLLLCVPLTGCDSEEGLDSEEIASIFEGVSTSTSDVDTITFDMDISADVEVEADDSVTVSIDGSSGGSIDIDNEEMYLPLTLDIGPGVSISAEIYIVDGWAYMNMDMGMFGGDSGWMKMEVPEEVSELQYQAALIGQLTDLLDLVEIDDMGSEDVNGVDCYKFQITPDLGELAAYAFQQFQQQGMDDFDLGGLAELAVLEEIISAFSVSCTFWIAEEDNLLMKVELDLSGDISSEDIPEMGTESLGSIDINMHAQIEFEYDQPVTIVLPAEALEAESGDFELPF